MILELRRETKKIMSEENLRLFANLLLSLSSKVQSAEDKLINNWVASTAYIKDESFVIYNELLYVCKVSNADALFDLNKWTCLSPTIEELSKSDVEAMLNLSQEELDNLQKLLKDDQITTTSTFSSSKIYSDIQAAIETAKEYTNEQTGKCVKPAYKVVASTGEVTEAGYFYLISNGTNYDMYVLSADGSVVSLGTSDVDLTQFYDKDYIDNNFYTSADADGKFATITTVDAHIDDADIHVTKELKDKLVTTDDITTTIDSTSTNDTITGTKAIYDYILANTDKFDTRGYAGDLDDVPFTIANATHCYLIYNSSCTNIPNNLTGTLYNTYFGDDKWATQLFIGLEGSIYTRNKANGTWSSWERYLRTADLTQTIDSSSTDTQVPSAKTIREYSLGFKYNHEFLNSDSLNIMLPYPGFYKFAIPTIGVPEGNPQDYVLLNIPWVETNRLYDTLFAEQFLFSPRVNYFWRRTVWNYQVDKYNPDSDNGTFNPWQRVCTTIVPDSEGTATINDGASGTISYKVVNGIAYVSVRDLAEGLSGVQTCTFTGLPKAAVYVNTSIEKLGSRVGTVYSDDGITFVVHKVSTDAGYGSFSYPVAKS